MPIIRLAWTDLRTRTHRVMAFEAKGIGDALEAAARLEPEVPIDLWIDGKRRAQLTRVVLEDSWYWRIGK